MSVWERKEGSPPPLFLSSSGKKDGSGSLSEKDPGAFPPLARVIHSGWLGGEERGKHFVYLPTFPSSSSSASSPCLLIEASWEAVGGTHIFRVWEEMKVLS